MSKPIDKYTVLALIAKVLQTRKKQEEDEVSEEVEKVNENFTNIPYEGVIYHDAAFNASYSKSHQDYYTPTNF